MTWKTFLTTIVFGFIGVFGLMAAIVQLGVKLSGAQ